MKIFKLFKMGLVGIVVAHSSTFASDLRDRDEEVIRSRQKAMQEFGWSGATLFNFSGQGRCQIKSRRLLRDFYRLKAQFPKDFEGWESFEKTKLKETIAVCYGRRTLRKGKYLRKDPKDLKAFNAMSRDERKTLLAQRNIQEIIRYMRIAYCFSMDLALGRVPPAPQAVDIEPEEKRPSHFQRFLSRIKS